MRIAEISTRRFSARKPLVLLATYAGLKIISTTVDCTHAPSEQTLKSNLQPSDQPIDVNVSETELEDKDDLATDPTG